MKTIKLEILTDFYIYEGTVGHLERGVVLCVIREAGTDSDGGNIPSRLKNLSNQHRAN